MKLFPMPAKKSESGFSLVELMIVVGIIGILTTLAVPRFQQFQSKARMGEAKNMLNQVFTLQESYHLDNNVYVALATAAAPYGRTPTSAIAANCDFTAGGAQLLGFSINPCAAAQAVPRFGYYSESTAVQSDFKAHAITGTLANNLVCPGSSKALDYTIDQNHSADFDKGVCAP